MSDCSAARGSKIILRISQLKSFKKLKLEKNISRYLRFRDAVSINLTFPKVDSPTTSDLRKSNNKYNITPPNSNVSWKF